MKTRSPTTAGPENPEPSVLMFQSKGGPSLGHFCFKPFSADVPSRCAPRHCGQSSACTVAQNRSVQLPMHNLAKYESIIDAPTEGFLSARQSQWRSGVLTCSGCPLLLALVLAIAAVCRHAATRFTHSVVPRAAARPHPRGSGPQPTARPILHHRQLRWRQVCEWRALSRATSAQSGAGASSIRFEAVRNRPGWPRCRGPATGGTPKL